MELDSVDIGIELRILSLNPGPELGAPRFPYLVPQPQLYK